MRIRWLFGLLTVATLLSVPSFGQSMDWTCVTDSAGWNQRYGHAAVVLDTLMWILGGQDLIKLRADAWYSRDGVHWTRATDSAGWSPRWEHKAVVFNNKMWVLGGSGEHADVWSSTDGAVWTRAAESAPWGNRVNHAATVYNGKMWVLGGYVSGTFKNDVWYSPDGATWTCATSSAPWSPRYWHGCAVYDGKMWVLGGIASGPSFPTDVWWSTDGANWFRATDSANWKPRSVTNPVVFQGRIWILGGGGCDVWYSQDAVHWTRATEGPPWTPMRYWEANVAYDSLLWLLGGYQGGHKHDVWFSRGRSVAVVAPNGGEALRGGTVTAVRWRTTGQGYSKLRVLLSRDAGRTFGDTIAGNVPPGDTSCAWVVPYSESESCLVRVQALAAGDVVLVQDQSDAFFAIRNAVSIRSPNGREYWAGGNTKTVRWLVRDTGFARLRLLLSTDGGSTYPETIARNIARTETTYQWLVPQHNSSRCLVKAQALDSLGAVVSSDMSDTTFTIDARAPSSFSLWTPPNNSWVKRSPIFTWQPATDSLALSHYRHTLASGGDTVRQESLPLSTTAPGSAWSRATDSAGWSSRYWHTSVSFDGKLWVLGGRDGGYRNDVWYSSDGSTWTRATAAAGWSPRYGHTSVVFKDKMWVIGGRDASGMLNDVWYSSDGVDWTRTIRTAPWLERLFHSSAAYAGKLWVLGGLSATLRNDVWCSGDGVDWTQVTAMASWEPRSDHRSVVYNDRMWVIGGSIADVHYSTDGAHWTEATDAAPWGRRTGMAVAVFLDRIWVTGGDWSGAKDDVWYSSDGANWTAAVDSAGWAARYSHTTESLGGRLWVVGGRAGGALDDVWSSRLLMPEYGEGWKNWFVDAFDMAGNSRRSTEAFTVGVDTTLPDTFALAYPRNGDTVYTRSPRLNWHPSRDMLSGLRKYQTWIDGRRNLDSVPAADTSTLTVGQLPYDTVHTWTVRAFDVAGNERPAAQAWSFLVLRDSLPPSVPVLIAPANGSCTRETVPTFWWHQSTDDRSGVDYYYMQYAPNSLFIGATTVLVRDTTCPAQARLVDSTYYWRVRAYDRAGNPSSWSSPWSFEVDTRVPGTPTLLEPLGGVWRNTAGTVFRWSPVTLGGTKGAAQSVGIVPSVVSRNSLATGFDSPVRYVLQVDTNPGFLAPLVTDTTAFAQDTIALAERGRYFWRVRALDLAGNQGSFSGRDSFGVDRTAPSIPVLVAPDSGQVRNNPVVTFLWRRSTDALSGVRHYALQYANNPGFSGAVLRDSLADTSYTTPTALADTTWYWRVRAADRAGNVGVWGQVRSFRIDTQGPMAPALVSPADGAVANSVAVSFVWRRSASSDVISYTLQYARDSLFSSPDSVRRPDTVATVTLSDTTWFWRVRGNDLAGNAGPWSSRRRLTVDTGVPGIPSLLSPLTGTWLNHQAVEFSWTAVTFVQAEAEEATGNPAFGVPVRYVLQVDTNRSFPFPLVTDTCTVTRDTVDLGEGRYFWRVRAYDLAGNQGSFSSADSFGVDLFAPIAPRLGLPDSGSVRNNAAVTFVWHRSVDNLSGVRHYALQYAGNPGLVGAMTRDSLADTSCVVSSLTDTTWYWRVRATDRAGNQGAWSSVWSFEVDTRAPGVPALLEPLSGAWLSSPSVVFEWAAVTAEMSTPVPASAVRRVSLDENRFIGLGRASSRHDGPDAPVRYILQVDTGRSFIAPVVVETTGRTQDTVLLPEWRYFWRVKAYDLAGNQGSFSSADSFGVDVSAPTVPLLVYPPNDTTVEDTVVLLVWHRSYDQTSGLAGYQVQLALDTGFTSIVRDTTQSDTSRWFALPETVYHWHIRASDRAGNRSNWSARRRFRLSHPVGVEEVGIRAPKVFALDRVRPALFNVELEVLYSLPTPGPVRLAVYSSTGREVACLVGGQQSAGRYVVRWNGRDSGGEVLPSGVYFVRLDAGSVSAAKKVVKLR